MNNQTRWSIDQANSEISFKVRHLVIAHVRGFFKIFDASIYTTGKDFATAEIDLWIDAASINTNDEKRDEHLRGPDFFDTQHYKHISFTANTIEQADEEGSHELWGELTMKGITNKIMLKVQFGGILIDYGGKEKASFIGIGKINRSDWGLNWNTTLETGGYMISEEVTISCEIELTKEISKNEIMDIYNETAIDNTP